MRLIAENRCVQALNQRERPCAFLTSFQNIAGANRNLRKNEVTNDGLIFQERTVEESGGRQCQPAGFIVATFVKQHDGLVEVDQPGPNLVLLALK